MKLNFLKLFFVKILTGIIFISVFTSCGKTEDPTPSSHSNYVDERKNFIGEIKAARTIYNSENPNLYDLKDSVIVSIEERSTNNRALLITIKDISGTNVIARFEAEVYEFSNESMKFSVLPSTSGLAVYGPYYQAAASAKDGNYSPPGNYLNITFTQTENNVTRQVLVLKRDLD
ncbi:MAG: hypothetical protein J7604_15975 [Sporocytophaga sp.]|uniref:hypothetical protein n=1 Tax=Sporocytophaga sp. TaxID=2231183 RepID=UPI001B03DE87|nr:hypothetical protein [Sporocytophaga sp.]MBO9701705.1 hypothetical protein [Sporocytophaga sp.]